MYRPLNGGLIRLLQMQPGHTLSTIECDFIYVDPYSCEDYVALSYTWQQAPEVPILVNGTIFLVSENLYLALLHIRKRQCTKIWVDAICIMQNDPEEKASQIQRMKDIYQQASIVHIWLGDGNSLTAHGFDVLHSMLEHLDWDGRVPAYVVDPDRLAEDPEKCRAISEILCRPWFRRTWVLQEVLAARRAFIICGKDMLSMDLFLQIIHSMLDAGALEWIMSYYTIRQEHSKKLMKVARKQLEFLVKAHFEKTDVLSGYGFKPTLLNLLASTRWSESSRPEDKVYGLISLAEDAKSLVYEEHNSKVLPFKVDCRLTKEQVFVCVTKAILHTTKSLDVLRFAMKRTDGNDGLPSWIPDWAASEPYEVHSVSPLVPTNESGQKSWRAADKGPDTDISHYLIRQTITNYCSLSFAFGPDNTLVIRGIHYDTISSVSTHTWPSLEDMRSIDSHSTNYAAQDKVLDAIECQLESIRDWIDDWIEKAAKCVPYPTGENISGRLWEVLSGGRTKTKSVGPLSDNELRRNIRDALSTFAFARGKYISMRSNTKDTLSEIVLETAITHFEDILSRFPHNEEGYLLERFATTRKNYVGLVPRNARVGDLVCIMYGCETPFILRRSGERVFQFLGPSSIYGLDFDSAVSESSFEKPVARSKKDFCFSGMVRSERRVYTTLKRTRDFIIV